LRRDGKISNVGLFEARGGEMAVELHGFQHSVYSWIARLALHEKGVEYKWVEVNPFSEVVPAYYLEMNPFKRVPTLVHGELVIYETNAITRYADEAFDGPHLQPAQPRERARCNQILSIVDNYAYWPLVRQVFSHGAFRPRMGLPSEELEIRHGLDAAPKVLGSLEQLASGSQFLSGDGLSLADIHLAPTIGYFTQVPEGSALFNQHERLSAWWSTMSKRATYLVTMPRLPHSLS
jgi:glutathione S-transferase